jgi:hypothetical protein
VTDKFWTVVDAITTECPTCAFLRGLGVGIALTLAVLWLR